MRGNVGVVMKNVRWCATRWVASARELTPPLALVNGCSRMMDVFSGAVRGN